MPSYLKLFPGIVRSNINMSSSNRRDGEIRDLLTIMGEKMMQSHLTKTMKVVRSPKVAEKLTLRGFHQQQLKCVRQNKEYVGVFALVNSKSHL